MEYFKVNITVFRCIETDDTSSSSEQLQSTVQVTPPVTDRSADEPLLKDFVGDGIFSSLHDFFRVPNDIEEDEAPDQESTVNVEIRDPCDLLIQTYGVYIHPWNLMIWILSCMLALVILVLFWKICRNVVRAPHWSGYLTLKPLKKSVTKLRAKLDRAESDSKSRAKNTGNTGETDECEAAEMIAKLCRKDDRRNSINGQLKLYHALSLSHKQSLYPSSVTKFLEETTNKLFSKLDRILLKGGPSAMDQTQSSIATPRLARRTLGRRNRVGSTPSLPLQGPSNSETDTGYTQTTESWEYLKRSSAQIGWRFPYKACPNVPGITRESQKLLQYFDRECPCNRDQWKATMLVINYVLYLIKSELESMLCVNGYRFVQFIPTGSLTQGTAVARLHAVDVLMLLQPKLIPEAVIHEFNSENSVQILPGKVVLKSDKFIAGHNITVNMGGKQVNCLSSKVFQNHSEDLIKECLQNLYSKTKSLMDRLPFQIRQGAAASLQLNIDTRALVGLGESEVKINLIPVIPLATEGILQSPVLYATPPIESFQEKQRSSSPTNSCPEMFWNIRNDAYENEFVQRVSANMRYSGIDSCHMICVMILKSLLTGCSKNSLLDRGVLPAHHINTVLHFLVLESTPEQWTYDHLGDRFSDIVHFLREAFTAGRLPGFFLNNPHLVDKMPSVAGNRLLTRRKQQNLLIDWPRERLDKCLDYMKDRLRETGLAECVKEDFSTDMWEYEFFIYN